MHFKSKVFSVALACAAAGFASSATADTVAEKGREILKKNQHAVVTVTEVLKMSASGSRSSETKQELTGTVVDPSGLTVLALSACDPSEIYQRVMGEEYSRRLETEVADLKILLDDGNEIPAEIVLRDKDLDLAFIRPKTKLTTPMAAVDLSKSSAAQVLDEVIALNRLKSAAGRAYSASLERVNAVVQKPRTFYIPDSNMTATSQGSPAFTIDGNILGMFVTRAMSAKGNTSRNYNDLFTSIILPAEDILKAAKQAPEAKGASADKKDAAKDSDDSKETNKTTEAKEPK
jgi:hypothetical protein